jgi:hypothetical protein
LIKHRLMAARASWWEEDNRISCVGEQQAGPAGTTGLNGFVLAAPAPQDDARQARG